jgi:hypothetical protein
MIRWFRGRDGSMDFEEDGEPAFSPSPDSAPPLAGMGSPGGAGCCIRCGEISDPDRTLCELCYGMPDDLTIEPSLYD